MKATLYWNSQETFSTLVTSVDGEETFRREISKGDGDGWFAAPNPAARAASLKAELVEYLDQEEIEYEAIEVIDSD